MCECMANRGISKQVVGDSNQEVGEWPVNSGSGEAAETADNTGLHVRNALQG